EAAGAPDEVAPDTAEPPAPAPAETSTAEPENAGKPRRRSTVREKVTFASQPEPPADVQTPEATEPAAAPEPTPPAQDSTPTDDDGGQPRRLGWWARRFGGA
ncbi:MAG: ribonuclease E/G, partial [Xanthobacteraceae bacterium]